MDQRLTAILPCNDLDAAQAFFEKLGFSRNDGEDGNFATPSGRSCLPRRGPWRHPIAKGRDIAYRCAWQSLTGRSPLMSQTCTLRSLKGTGPQPCWPT